MQDLYLPTNALAALANLAPQVTGLHSHAAQRLVGLTSSMARRWLKLTQAAETALQQPSTDVQVSSQQQPMQLTVSRNSKPVWYDRSFVCRFCKTKDADMWTEAEGGHCKPARCPQHADT